jgi:predicted nuclease of predicted toxin-antitoxin system
LSQSHLPSVITFRLNDMQPGQVNRYLAQTLAHFSEQIEAGALVSVNEQAIRVRPLPVRDSSS